MPEEITDPTLIKELQSKMGNAPVPITDPKLIEELKNKVNPPKSLLENIGSKYKAFSESLVESIPGATQALSAIEAPLRGMSYDELVRNTRAAQQKAKAEEPMAYETAQALAIAGPMAASMGTSAVPSLAKAALPTLAKSVGAGMGLGYLNSAFDPTKDVMTETALGGSIPLTMRAGGKTAKFVYNTGKNALEWGTGQLFNISPEVLGKLRANPNLIDQISQLPYDQQKVMNDYVKFFENSPYRKREQEAFDKAVQVFNKPQNLKKTIDLKIVQDEINKAYENVPKVMGKADTQYLKDVDDYADRFRAKGKVTPQEALDILRSLYADTNFGDYAQKTDKTNHLLKNITAKLRSEIGKQVPEYNVLAKDMEKNIVAAKEIESKFFNEKMKDVSKMSGTSARVEPKSVERFITEAMKPTKSGEPSSEFLKAQEYGKEIGYGNFGDIAENVRMQNYLESRKNQGSNIMSRFGLMGLAGASMVDDPLLKGLMIGTSGLAGAAAEQKGGKAAGYIMKGINAPEEIIKKVGNTKYAPQLKDALSKGNKSFATTHYLLLQRDPEYRKQIEEE